MSDAAKVFDFMDDDREKFLKIKHDEAKRYIDPETGKIFADMVDPVDCPVCELQDQVFVFMKAGFDFVKCRQCGLLHVSPQLKPGIQDEIYKNSETADHWIQLQKKQKEQSWNAEKKYLPALREMENLMPQGGKLLDVGCSIGQFLDLARNKGWEVEGVELNEDAAAVARKEFDLTVHSKKLEDVGFDPESFDVITLWGVFEHLTDPNGMLRDVRKLLKPGGLILLFVPNGHSLIIRLSRENNSTVSGRAHLWYFSPSTMGRILEKNGFEKSVEFAILPQVHEIEHFLQYNRLYQEPDMACAEEFTLPQEVRDVLGKYIEDNMLGYKMITIGRRVDS